jgi:hypothetical protein
MRLCGIYNDNIQLTCFLEKNIYENLYKGFKLQEDIFSRMKKEEISIDSWLQNQIFFNEKIPKKKLMKKKKFGGSITYNKNEDNGLQMSAFEENIEGVDLHKLKRWINNGLIGKMIRFLFDSTQSITFQEFKKGIDYEGDDKKFRSNYDNGCGLKTHYGKLWIMQSDNKILLNPKIREYITKKNL